MEEFPALEILFLDDKKSIDYYNDLVQTCWLNLPFYKYEFLTLSVNDYSKIMVFILRGNNSILALMPMIKREIPIQIDGETYYDVISPYGYSGPLFMKNLDPSIKSLFWKLIDHWYDINKIVCEFIRFNLDSNYELYSGNLVPTLKNVVGKVLKDQETQWENYLPKVRNNYRRALKSNLSFRILKGKSIGDEDIRKFHDLYIKIMTWKKASKEYLFSLPNLIALIRNNPQNFILVFTEFENKKISTELLISHNKKLFAFLGATDRDFQFYRPNDFLRVEMIKWASKEDFNSYILGGGMIDGDGLYKHKKSFFPKDRDVIFYTGRKVVLKGVFDQLNLVHADELKKEKVITPENFFPDYRR